MKSWKILITILLIVIAIGVIVGFFFINNNINKSNVLNTYNLTETEYNELKILADKLIKKLAEENVENSEIYYSKDGEILVARGQNKEELESTGPIDIGNDTYIVVSSDNIEVLEGTEKISFGTETVNSWYGDGFINASEDTEYKEYIFFENLEELENLID